MKIKKGDQVKIIAGNDKGKQGKVMRVMAEVGRITVEGINIKKKHVRPRKQGSKGEVISFPMPIAISRVMIICPKCGKVARMGYKKTDSGSKSRVCKKCEATV